MSRRPPLYRIARTTRPHEEKDHKARHDRERPCASRRGYDRSWCKLRDAVIIEHGCRCSFCGCLVVLRKKEATSKTPLANVDHIDGNVWNRERDNLRVLCASCHSRRTARDQGFAQKRRMS